MMSRPVQRPDEKRAEGSSKGLAWVALVVVLSALVFVAVVRLRVADIPLERDEGEYAYAGQLILHGVPPYRFSYNMKFPGTYYVYALTLAALGETPRAIRIGLLIVNAITTGLVFLIGRRLLGELAAAAAAVAFALLSVDRWVMGIFAHATHFVLLPALGGLWLLLRSMHSNRRPLDLLAGVLLGAAVLMKQHGVFFLLLGIAIVLWDETRREPRDLRLAGKRVALLMAGALTPVALLIAVLAGQGVVGRFWFWTFQGAAQYVSELSLSDAPTTLLPSVRIITRAMLPFWILGGVGVLLLLLVRWGADARFFLSALFAASLLAISPGLYFREHYFILLLPSVALFVGVALASLVRIGNAAGFPRSARLLCVAFFGAMVLQYVANEREYLFSMSADTLGGTLYGSSPFRAAIDIAGYLREHTNPDDRIAVLGSEPEIYFYADRTSASGYIYTYPLMERQKYSSRMKDEMIREIEAAHPKYLVFVQVPTSWLVHPQSDLKIFSWIERYTSQCYELIGITEIDSIGQSHSYWEGELKGYKPSPGNRVYTFLRKGDLACSVEASGFIP